MGTSDVYDTINFIMAGAGGGIGRTKTPVHARVCVYRARALFVPDRSIEFRLIDSSAITRRPCLPAINKRA